MTTVRQDLEKVLTKERRGDERHTILNQFLQAEEIDPPSAEYKSNDIVFILRLNNFGLGPKNRVGLEDTGGHSSYELYVHPHEGEDKVYKFNTRIILY